MVKLSPRSPAQNLLPRTIGAVTISEVSFDHMTLLTPLGADGGAGFSAALKSAHGMAAPAPNRATGREAARALWFGHGGQVMLMGPAADAGLARHATRVDQSDAWCVIRLDGPGSTDVMARLTPLDLRPDSFRRGHAARSLIGHMSGGILRLGPDSWQIMVFRSMAHTLVHECDSAARAVAARSSP